MTDEPNEEQEMPEGVPPFIAHMFGPTPEQIDQMNMERAATAHEFRSFFTTLSPEQITYMRKLMFAADDNSLFIGQVIGMLNAFGEIMHNMCAACGVDHSKEAQEVLTDKTIDEPHGPPTEGPELEELYSHYEVHEGPNGAVVCNNCGASWTSIEDRMLRPPGVKGCANCQHKEKWG